MRATRTAPNARKTSRRRAIIAGLVTVLLTAAVLLLAVALSPPKGATVEPEVLPPAQQESTALLQEAEQALASGDTTAAAALATQVLTDDPSNTAAADLVVRAKAAQSASNDDDSPAVSDKDPDDAPAEKDDAFLSKVPNMAALFPTSFAKYSLGDVVVTKIDAQVSATPESQGSAATQVLWVVHQTADADAASKFVRKTSKVLYDEDADTITVDDAKTHFGTDGERYATATYVRGRYVFEVLVAADGVDPAQNKKLALAAAEAFKDEPK